MRQLFFTAILLLIMLLSSSSAPAGDDSPQSAISDNEFAEFELPEEDNFVVTIDRKETSEKIDNDDADQDFDQQTSEKGKGADQAEDFSFLADEEEFEHIEKTPDPETELNQEQEEAVESARTAGENIKPLTFADVPSHFRSNWSSYQVESIALLIIFIYVLNYIYGKSRNHSIALKWFAENREELEKQFALVGDDGTSTEEMASQSQLIRETEYSYWIWSTGRVGCKGMLTQIKLSKRQDLLGVTLNMIRPRQDRVIHTIDLDPGEMDSFVIIFGQRKTVQKAVKEMNDLAAYVSEKKNFEKVQVPSTICVHAEIAETVPAIIDATTVNFLKKCDKYIDYIHISDQYSGPKPQDEQLAKLPETHPTLIFSYLVGDSDSSIDQFLLNFTFYMLDKVRYYRLSKEGKIRADKKRQNVQENFLKLTHLQRQEAAQTRREEKTRERKQRVMEEENPERQKRLEKMEQKRDAKNKQPKIKQFKIK